MVPKPSDLSITRESTKMITTTSEASTNFNCPTEELGSKCQMELSLFRAATPSPSLSPSPTMELWFSELLLPPPPPAKWT